MLKEAKNDAFVDIAYLEIGEMVVAVGRRNHCDAFADVEIHLICYLLLDLLLLLR